MTSFPRSKEKSTEPTTCTVSSSKLQKLAIAGATVALTVAVPAVAFGSVESSLIAVQTKLVGTILPLAAICGLVVAGFSFVAGHPNARAHLSLAIMGAIIGFGAESIVALIRSLIQ
jgi:type IV secretory pathway VirB2 component (pilin)